MARRWQSWASLVAGVWLVVSPWVLGFSSDSTMRWTAFGVGLAVALVGVWALAMPAARYAEWSAAALGAGLFVAPWTLSSASEASAAWNAWIIGVVVVILAVWSLLAMAGRIGRTAGRRQRPAH